MLPVRAAGLEVVFGSGDGLGPVDLRVGPGEAVLVLGPSGCGKTTLLHCLTGAVPHAVDARTSGEVEVCGVLVGTSDVATVTRQVGVLAQDPETGVCLPEVADEVAFPLENRAVDPTAIGVAVDRALVTAGVLGLRERATTGLSGGELQRVALAAATATTPALLVLDEPTSMLDATGVVAVRRAVDAAQLATGAAVVLVEHRLDEYAGADGVAGLPARTLVLDRGGRVVADGPSGPVLDEHAADLLRAGCWLPLEVELRALFGQPDGLGSVAVQRALLEPAASAPASAGADRDGDRGRGGGAPLSLDGAALVAPGPIRRPPPTRSRRSPSGGRRSRGERSRGERSRGERTREERTGPPALLRDLDLRLERGELVALVGGNGSGKTTLLSCLAGLHPPVVGTRTGPRAGLVFQNPEHQFTQTSVRAEVAVGLPAGSQARVDAALTRFGLADLAGHDPFRLSGGQQRRLSLAAMLVHERPFLLADEPGHGLDRHGSIAVMRALAEAPAQGRGVLFATHDLRALCGYADRVLVLGGGGLLADTTPLALLRADALLTAAGLAVPQLLGWLRDRVATDAELAGVLRGLDRRTLPPPGERAVVPGAAR